MAEKKISVLYEQHLLSGLKQGNQDAFSVFFKTYYLDLVLFAGIFIKERTACEDIVQSVFTKLWSDRNDIEIQHSLKSYLLRAVKNACLDELRHREIVHTHQESELFHSSLAEHDLENYILYSDLQEHLRQALEKLPEAYRQAFEMNRFENLKYREIAAELHVSERTVEVRIGKALELLRKYLSDFLVFLSFLY